ncbi:MAG: hypothetical protein CFE21_11720 [Bacteroidetes bacterium B1(2017)]|nr:MAG: hypothetical protein CFE21_11720 [Bacteroidetes bacterium B1(2017)]
MKIIERISLLLFLIGIAFKLLHWAGADIILLVGCAIFFSVSLIHFFKNIRNNIAYSFLYLSFSLWIIYFLFRLLYWPGGPSILFGFKLVFFVPFFVSIAWFALQLQSKTRFRLPQFMLIAFFLFSWSISYRQSDEFYYFFYLNPVLNKTSREYNYRSWDKYSWFLYNVKKQEEAIEANTKAQEALDKQLNLFEDPITKEYSTILKQHRQLILDHTWRSFR